MNQTGWRFTMKEKVMGLVFGVLLLVMLIGAPSVSASLFIAPDGTTWRSQEAYECWVNHSDDWEGEEEWSCPTMSYADQYVEPTPTPDWPLYDPTKSTPTPTPVLPSEVHTPGTPTPSHSPAPLTGATHVDCYGWHDYGDGLRRLCYEADSSTGTIVRQWYEHHDSTHPKATPTPAAPTPLPQDLYTVCGSWIYPSWNSSVRAGDTGHVYRDCTTYDRNRGDAVVKQYYEETTCTWRRSDTAGFYCS